jgi:hypothetical protein
MKSTPLLVLLMALAGTAFSATFKTAVRVPAGTAPSAIAVGDFNKDGKLDMIVANKGDSSAQVFLGNGNGTFKSQPSVALDGAPIALAVGDFNGDGFLDVVALTTDVFVLLGNGNGTFRVGGILATVGKVTSLVVADFNADGKLDLAVTEGNFSEVIGIFLGKGDGTFKIFGELQHRRRFARGGGGRLQRRRQTGSRGVQL